VGQVFKHGSLSSGTSKVGKRVRPFLKETQLGITGGRGERYIGSVFAGDASIGRQVRKVFARAGLWDLRAREGCGERGNAHAQSPRKRWVEYRIMEKGQGHQGGVVKNVGKGAESEFTGP